MVEVLGTVLMYLNPYQPVQVDSPFSDLARQVINLLILVYVTKSPISTRILGFKQSLCGS